MNWSAPRICSFNFPSHRSQFEVTFYPLSLSNEQLISKALLVCATFPPKNRHKHNSQWRLSTPSPSTLKLPPKLHAHTEVLLPCSVAVELFQTVVCSEWLRHIRGFANKFDDKELEQLKDKRRLSLAQSAISEPIPFMAYHRLMVFFACLFELGARKEEVPTSFYSQNKLVSHSHHSSRTSAVRLPHLSWNQ